MEFIINYSHPDWTAATFYKGELGLGVPYTNAEFGPEIIMSEDILRFKRQTLIRERAAWADCPIPPGINVRVSPSRASYNLRREYEVTPGSSGRSKFRRTFERRLYAVLYPTSPGYPRGGYWGSGVLGTLGQFETNRRALQILDAYIALIDKILLPTEGLSKFEESIPGETPDSTTPTGGTADAPVRLTVVANATKQLLFDFLTIETVEVPLLASMLANTSRLVNAKTAQFFDRHREYKTVLNFGNDKQYLVEAWRQGTSADTIQLKLTSPLDSDVEVYDSAYIVRDISKPVVDIIQVESAPLIDTTPYLRPRNTQAAVGTRQFVNEVTINTLGMYTGSAGMVSSLITGSTISYEDRVFNRWYTADFKASELNVDFTDYNNFVHFSSAATRLAAFRNKLIQIEALATTASISGSDLGERKRALEVEHIRRNFDPYEQFLYYADSTFDYSASAYYTNTGTEYSPLAAWPKTGSVLYSVDSTSGSAWYTTQSAIASRFDEFNHNYLGLHLPTHIQEDEESVEFLTLVAMFGHFMDNIKLYIDQFQNIYSTTPDPYTDLTMDQVYEVAQSFGFDLPNAYALEQLQTFISSVYDGEGTRALVAETWKRYLHSAIYLTKAKGSRVAVDGLMNVYGINSPIVQLKESGYPSRENYVQSDELTYGLTFTSSINNNISLPFVSSSLTASSLQIRFNPTLRQSSSIVTGDQKWAIDLVPHPSASKLEYGRIHVVSGSGRTLVATSSYFPLFSDDYTNIMLVSQSTTLSIIQTDGDQILHTQTIGSGLSSSLWRTTTRVYIGGSGSIRLNNFDGIVDEARVWGEQISDALFTKQAYDPGSYYGATYTSSYSTLHTHLAFSQPIANITSSATNESPYASASLVTLPTFGFTTASYERVLRSIKQFVPMVGATSYSNKKITVAPAPTFTDLSVDDDGVPLLSRTNSIKKIRDKKYTGGHDLISFALSPLDFVNQNIMRTMGVVDINYLIGSPRKITAERYDEVDALYGYYKRNYSKTIDPNQYIRFFKNVIKGPSEQIEKMIPARASLIDGVVIESPILDRKRNNITRAFRVDGSNTKTFLNLIGSASNAYTSSLAGAYSFEAIYDVESTFTNELLPSQRVYQYINPHTIVTSSLVSDNSGIAFINSIIDVGETVGPASSTAPSELPAGKQFLVTMTDGSNVSHSMEDSNSSYNYLETILENVVLLVTQSGYPRNPYLGTSITQAIGNPGAVASELHTLEPFYDIPPRSDFDDVGTTSYFHLNSGIYKFPSRTSRYAKQFYLAKFINDAASPVNQLYSPITLLDTGSLGTLPGRDFTSIASTTYGAGATVSGTIKFAKIAALVGVVGSAGLEITLTSVTDGEVVFQGTIENDSDVNPYVLLQSGDGFLDYTIRNTTAAPLTSEIVFYYFTYEPLDLIPRGYLPRHYRYSRNRGSAQQRRNISGCRQIFCPEICPPGVSATESTSPVQITIATRTNPVVKTPDKRKTKTIKYGGRGPIGEEPI